MKVRGCEGLIRDVRLCFACFDKMESSPDYQAMTVSRLRPFSVDSSLIPAIDSSDELRELGVSAYAQEEFEKGVIEQVDKALAEQEAVLREKRLRRDVKGVLDEIR